MNILLTLLYSVVWLACTILGRVAPESVARAWCEYHLEGMSILRYTYRSLAKAAEMREGKTSLSAVQLSRRPRTLSGVQKRR